MDSDRHPRGRHRCGAHRRQGVAERRAPVSEQLRDAAADEQQRAVDYVEATRDPAADDTATGEGWVRPCRDRAAHMGHYWPYYCYGVTEEGEKRTRFRSQQHHSATVTRDDDGFDGGLSSYEFDDEGPDGKWRDR